MIRRVGNAAFSSLPLVFLPPKYPGRSRYQRLLYLEYERTMGGEQPPANPPMRIFVLCDGTGQDAVRNWEPTQHTNVHRFRQCVKSSKFVKHMYQAGVGTHAPADASTMSLSNISDLRYQATGSGE